LDGPLHSAVHIFRRKHKQHVEWNNNVRTERVAREERSPHLTIRSSKHMHLYRMERLAARVAEDAVFRAEPGFIHFAIRLDLLARRSRFVRGASTAECAASIGSERATRYARCATDLAFGANWL